MHDRRADRRINCGRWLHWLDMATHRERLAPIDAGLAQRVQALVGNLEVDFNAALTV
jgi:hypothetical protein